jgi:hypothetical protein
MVAQRAAVAPTAGAVPRVGRGLLVTLSEILEKAGVRSTHFYGASVGSISLCVGLWIRAKTVDQDERGNAERRALFVGLWPPMFWLMGDSLRDSE